MADDRSIQRYRDAGSLAGSNNRIALDRDAQLSLDDNPRYRLVGASLAGFDHAAAAGVDVALVANDRNRNFRGEGDAERLKSHLDLTDDFFGDFN